MYVYPIFVYELMIFVLFSNSLFAEMNAKAKVLRLGWLLAFVLAFLRNTSLLPNSVISSAIQFESFVVMTKNHVRGCTNKMMRADHDAVVEAIL